MKIRNDFVTNSSSSSFIISFDENTVSDKLLEEDIKKLKKYIEDKNIDVIEACKQGETEFGWGWEIFTSFMDKVNYLSIQISNCIGDDEDDAKDDYGTEVTRDTKKVKKLLEEILMEELGVRLDYGFLATETFNCYVDHQSSFYENGVDKCLLDKKSLKRFLFSRNMYIIQGNDNSDMPRSILEHAFDIYKKAIKNKYNETDEELYNGFLEKSNLREYDEYAEG